MPPKGKKHLSYADVQDRKKELDEKLKKWVKDMDDAGIKEPNQTKLQETFTKSELEVFWKRLETKRGSSALTIQGPEVENAQRVPPPRRRWLAADSRDSLRGVHAVAYRPGSDNQSNFPSDVSESSP